MGAPITEDFKVRYVVPPEERVDVIQADREAAAELGLRWLRWTERQASMTQSGDGDEYPIVQALARHRLNSVLPVYPSLDEIPERP